MDLKPLLNFKKSKKDIRDKILLFSEIVLPETYDMRIDLMPCRDQGMQGSCYAQSAACMKEWQEKKNYGFEGYFSPQFFYCNRDNLYDNDFSNDEGMFGRDVMKVLLKTGICKEDSCPYGSVFNKNDISLETFEEAKNHTISGYASIRDIKTLKKSLIENGPALIGVPVYNYTDQMWNKNPGDGNLGGHAMTIVGYNTEGFIIRNSWGTYWGDNGYCIYNYEDWGVHFEIWATIDDLSSNNIYVESKNKDNEDDNETEDNQLEDEDEDNEDDNETEGNQSEDEDRQQKKSRCSKFLKKIVNVIVH